MAVGNEVVLVGNLTDDPELRYTPSGVPVASFTVAVNRPTAGGASRSTPSGVTTSGVGRRAEKPVNGTPGADPAASADAGVASGEGPLALPPAPTDSPTGGAVAVGPLVAASGTPRSAASGLLALVAAVCAIGVTVVAIRAIVSQRTSRIRLA